METFCEQNDLELKALKEVHYLCIQLQKMMHEDLLSGGKSGDSGAGGKLRFDFAKDTFKSPSSSQ